MKYIIRGETEQRNMLEHIGQMRLGGKIPEITIEEYDPDRSLDQNALINAMYPEIAKQMEGETVLDIKRYCKLKFGCPILGAEDEKFRRVYNMGLRHLQYEHKLEAMDILPVTSRMKKKMASQYIDAVIQHYSEQGIKF